MSTVHYHAIWMAHLGMHPIVHCVLLCMGCCSSKTILHGNIKLKSQSSMSPMSSSTRARFLALRVSHPSSTEVEDLVA